MLGDISNHRHAAPGSPTATSKHQRVTKDLASSSSSSPSRLAGSSSPFFSTSRLDAFHAASSSPAPAPSSKRSNLLASLPPSSPSFGLSSSAALAEDEGLLDADEPDSDSKQLAPVSLRLERGTVLYFGRKAKKAIPRVRSPGANPAEQTVAVVLPKSAKNASRIHCSARIVEDRKAQHRLAASGKTTIEVRVTGQNGMRIDGKLWKAGSLARLTVENGRELEFAFWGWDANVTVIGGGQNPKKQATTTKRAIDEPLKRYREPSPTRSTRTSSGDDNDDIEACGPASKRVRRASPALSIDSLSSLASSPSLSPAAARARTLAASSSLDLAGLLASTIVFHPRSTVGVDELVRALLKESGPQLWQVLGDDPVEVERLKETSRGEEDAVRAWTPVCQEVLGHERMFGVIDNTGLKDAAGRPLPPYYYYIPDLDSSRSRVEALEPFVKRVRGARTSKPIRYFWAKPK